MKILVTGAAGTVGGGVARALAGTGHQTVALVRDPAKYDAPEGVEVIQGDLTVADDVGRALPLGDRNVLTARHRAGEQALTAAGVPATFLRPSEFDYNFLMWTADAGKGVVRAPWLDVKLPVVHPDDIAACVVAVLVAGSPAGGAYSITGPDALSVADQTAIAASVLGRELRGEQFDLQVAKSHAFPDSVVDSVFGTFGPEAAVVPVSGGVQALTGRPAHTFAQWVEWNRAAFA